MIEELVQLSALPEPVLAGLFKASNGDCAWRRSDLGDVTQSLTDNRCAILSGEVWVVEGSLFSSLSPVLSGGWSVIYWECPDREPNESWDDFIQRTFEETWRAI